MRKQRRHHQDELRLLNESFGNLLRETHLVFMKVLREKLQPHGVSTSQWYYLRALWIEDGLTHAELAERTSTSRATTTAGLQVLERDGYILRKVCLDDRRLVRVYLTPKAQALKIEILPYSAEVNGLSLQGLPPERVQVAREVLLQMRRNLLSSLPAQSASPGPSAATAQIR